jgi:hypothetical protein
MAVFTAYFDASGSPDQSPALALGGLVSTAEKWIDFAKEWEGCLNAFGVSTLHMKDFTQSRREFSKWKLDDPPRRRFINGLIKIIEQYVEYTTASTVLLNSYADADQTFCLREFMKPYTLGASTCVSGIIPWAISRGHDPKRIAYIFEKGDADQSDVSRCWKAQFPEYEISPVFLKKRDRHPDPKACGPIRPFEAADLIAYENFRANIAADEDGNVYRDQLRGSFLRMENLPGAEGWAFQRKAEIGQICSHWRVPLRAPQG